MSEFEMALSQAVPLISAAVATYGAGVLARVEDAAAEATVGLGRRLLQRIWSRSPQPALLEAAVRDLADTPDDADTLAALRLQVRKVLSQDAALMAELVQMLPARGAVIASGAGALAVGGDLNVSAGGGVAAGVIQGPAVVVNPTAPGPERG